MTKLKKLVLCDDEQFIAIAYKDGLERAGYEVTVARDGNEALKAVQAIHPDLLLLDLIMPGMNGFELLKTMKSDATLKDIPVLVLSNLSQHNDETEVRALGAVDFIIKADTSLKELIERVESVVVA